MKIITSEQTKAQTYAKDVLPGQCCIVLYNEGHYMRINLHEARNGRTAAFVKLETGTAYYFADNAEVQVIEIEGHIKEKE